jgi:hypothetical protein
MKDHLKQSRIAKALTDRANGAASFDVAERRLNSVRLAIVLTPDHAATTAGQAAALTAVNTGFKCFSNVTLVADPEVVLDSPLPIGETIGNAATKLGAVVAPTIPPDSTHVIEIGNSTSLSRAKVFIRCWWNGWTAGIVPAWDDRVIGASGNPLAGVFSGALAVREVFATVLGYPRCGSRVSTASLWEPGSDPETTSKGPDTVYISPRLWFIGLGHLGQGHLWCLGLLPIDGLEAALQDDQSADEENEATGLLTRGNFAGVRKARIAAKWLDRPGWSTRLIERRHYGDIPLLNDDPSIVITSLDAPGARIQIANAGFEYMIDAGIGHGPIDFEGLQIRVLRKGVNAAAFWSSPERPKSLDKLMEREAYRAHEAGSDACGALTLANASVAVPFVGAAVGALTIAQAIRLASMQTTVQMMQMELGAPGMAVVGATNPAPTESRGSIEVRFGAVK